MEVKFEDFKAKSQFYSTKRIVRQSYLYLFLLYTFFPPKYVGGKKGYKKNKYKYDDRTIRLVEENWDFALKQWDYNL